MKLDKFNHLKYSDYWPHLYCHTPNVSVDISFGLLQTGWLVGLFYAISTLFGSFNGESSHFDKKNFLLVWFGFMAYQRVYVIKCQIHFYTNKQFYQGRALRLSIDCSTLLFICTLYCWVLSKEVSNTIIKVFDMTRPGIKPRSPGPSVSTLLIRPLSRYIYILIFIYFINSIFYILIKYLTARCVTTIVRIF